MGFLIILNVKKTWFHFLHALFRWYIYQRTTGSSIDPYLVSFEIILLLILSETSSFSSIYEKLIASLLQRPSEMEISSQSLLCILSKLSNALILNNFLMTAKYKMLAKLLYLQLAFFQFDLCYINQIAKKKTLVSLMFYDLENPHLLKNFE